MQAEQAEQAVLAPSSTAAITMEWRSSATLFLLVALAAWAVNTATRSPQPTICGSPGGPPITAPRVLLRDGRYLAYKESGVPLGRARHKFVVSHGFSGSRHFAVGASNELVEELGLYFVTFDRAGYGESVPNPRRSVKSEALDIEELADELGLGDKFYVLGVSMGTRSVYGCLHYIPHRLAGAVLVVPVVNYWWPSFPWGLAIEGYWKQLAQDRWVVGVAHYAPSLLYWWMTQKWFPSSAVATRHPGIFSRRDKEILAKLAHHNLSLDMVTKQGVHESLHRDMMVGFGTWEFDPMKLENPFSDHNESSVHIWQGKEDRLVPYSLQRFLAKKLPWIKYHEVPDCGHLLILAEGMADVILRSLIFGEDHYSVDI